MLSLDTAIGLFGVSVLLGLSPGPDNVFVLMQSATHGRRAGYWVTGGLCTGLIVHTLAVAAGVASIIASMPPLLKTIQLLGAGYLAWMAWATWRAPPTGLLTPSAQALKGRGLFIRGILMNLSNPKVLLFFLAFLPQFVDQRAGSVGLQMLMLGGVFILATLGVFGAIAWSGAGLGRYLRQQPGAGAWLQRLSSVVLGGLAIRLAWSDL